MKKHIPNILTISRIALTFVLFAILLTIDSSNGSLYFWCFVFFAVISATDFLDGFLARRWKVESRFGRVADPFADKIFIAGCFLIFAFEQIPVMENLPAAAGEVIRWGLAAVILLRESAVTIVRQIAEKKGFDFSASQFGKVKMFSQCVLGAYVLVHSAFFAGSAVSDWLLAAGFIFTAVATAGSGIEAAIRLYKAYKNQHTPA
ncbi:CDP-diacylglycerol--glycerol-3-phosphate 3-phosphatidyltransferase [Sedimentisphaera cyanobacteriorum]|uniref:CDP-diacylglycerol--glycerol-3-phosphate 3-phosphatidyltransferase n=1 Tax=Sedimentisphaera cyanobacteriorum TaxID=1940790 RepID=A0A1Q2HS22_9BACT|nr:CDP-alcohol phosphatidyltransferase family protein [Sedimentisphaera cyanobacteriorum]AQQ10131.1 CDP-diacylglycerol--glycerol-3-phosphate 3-phosphatidyltransferase [Sedimentisphaera cyanobacteriorum]